VSEGAGPGGWIGDGDLVVAALWVHAHLDTCRGGGGGGDGDRLGNRQRGDARGGRSLSRAPGRASGCRGDSGRWSSGCRGGLRSYARSRFDCRDCQADRAERRSLGPTSILVDASGSPTVLTGGASGPASILVDRVRQPSTRRVAHPRIVRAGPEQAH